MKIVFGFNDIRQDGMGSEAISLMRTIQKQGIEVQPIHAWKDIHISGYEDEFHPIFIHNDENEPKIEDVIERMVSVINQDKDCTFFSHFGAPNWACVIPYLRNDIKIIVSVHSITPSALKTATAYKDRISAFIAISKGVQKKLVKKLDKYNQSKVTLITNAINTNFYSPNKSSNIESNDLIKIIFLGRIEDYTKGCDKIPKIAKKLKEKGLKFKWDFYGYFHWGYEERFYSQLEELKVSDVIQYKGCVNQEDVPKILRNYDIMVMPSNHEGFGLALAEAMSTGLVCVASKIPDVTDMILESGKEGFLINRNDIQGFANAIEKLAKSKPLREIMGSLAREKIINNFSIENQGNQYLKLFNYLVNISNYKIIPPKINLQNFYTPEEVKSHKLARILPIWLKKFLKKYV